MNDTPDIPEFLNRKINPSTPATFEERQAFAPSQPVTPPRLFSTINEQELREEKKAKARARIAKMKAKFGIKSQTDHIPDEFLCWDSRSGRFYDVRVRMSRRLVMTREQMGLPPLSKEEVAKSVARCLGTRSTRE